MTRLRGTCTAFSRVTIVNFAQIRSVLGFGKFSSSYQAIFVQLARFESSHILLVRATRRIRHGHAQRFAHVHSIAAHRRHQNVARDVSQHGHEILFEGVRELERFVHDSPRYESHAQQQFLGLARGRNAQDTQQHHARQLVRQQCRATNDFDQQFDPAQSGLRGRVVQKGLRAADQGESISSATTESFVPRSNVSFSTAPTSQSTLIIGTKLCGYPSD